MLAAFARLVASGPPGRPTVLMAATVNEEHGFSGVKALCRTWDHPGICFRRPDAAVIAEPTELSVVVAHKGVVRLAAAHSGRAAHASQPKRGENAIYRLAPVLTALERYASRDRPHVGRASAVRAAHVERRHGARWSQREHGPRSGDDRNRSPGVAGRRPASGLSARRRLSGTIAGRAESIVHDPTLHADHRTGRSGQRAIGP